MTCALHPVSRESPPEARARARAFGEGLFAWAEGEGLDQRQAAHRLRVSAEWYRLALLRRVDPLSMPPAQATGVRQATGLPPAMFGIEVSTGDSAPPAIAVATASAASARLVREGDAPAAIELVLDGAAIALLAPAQARRLARALKDHAKLAEVMR